MESDQKKWDERYDVDGYLLGNKPSSFLEEKLELILSLCPGRRALDIACGEGRNSLFLARHGFKATGLDISERGLDKARKRAGMEGVSIDYFHVDLDEYEIKGPFDLIININFLQRGLFPKMVSELNPGGVILVETIMDAPNAPPTTNKLFLLQPGELERLFRGYDGKILHSSEHIDGSVPLARLVFQKG